MKTILFFSAGFFLTLAKGFDLLETMNSCFGFSFLVTTSAVVKLIKL